MELIRQLDEALTEELIDIHEDVLNFMDSCLLIESDHKRIHDSATSFLAKFAEEIRHEMLGSVGNRDTKNKFNLFTVLHLLLKPQKTEIEKIPSVRKYMHSKVTEEEANEVDGVLLGALNKLKGEHNVSGKSVRDEFIQKYADDPKEFAKTVSSLKAKYTRMAKKV